MRALVVEDNVAQLNGLAEIIEESFPRHRMSEGRLL